MTKKKKFNIGDLVYFHDNTKEVGIVLSHGTLDSSAAYYYDVFWFRTVERMLHSEPYLNKLKRQR